MTLMYHVVNLRWHGGMGHMAQGLLKWVYVPPSYILHYIGLGHMVLFLYPALFLYLTLLTCLCPF